MTDSIENTLNAARELGESYRKLGDLLLEQYRVLGEIRERGALLTQTYATATADSYSEVVSERLAQMEESYAQMQTLYQRYETDAAAALKERSSDWGKWLQDSYAAFQVPGSATPERTEQIADFYENLYSAYRNVQGADAGWTYNYGYPFSEAEATEPEVKQAA